MRDADAIVEMLDHFRIRQVLERYCRGVDRLDKALLDSVYWPDATDDHGLYAGPGIEFSNFLFPNFANYVATMHVIAQSNIEVTGLTAVAETYFIAGHRAEQEEGTSFLTAWGRYVDRLEKRNDEWRIADRVVVLEHVSEDPSVINGPIPLDIFPHAQRNTGDISYRGRSSLPQP
jgi:hypothetical protein